MKVTIVASNQSCGLFVFSCDGEYGYFELLGAGDIEIEDTLIGDFSSLGGATAKVKRTGEVVDIFIEDFCSYENAMIMIKR